MRIKRTRLALLLMVLVEYIVPAAFVPFLPWLLPLFEDAARVRFWGPLSLGVFCMAASVVPFPTFVAVLAAGFLLGVVLGSVVSILGTTVGACVAFLLARIIARRWAGGRAILSGRLAVLDQAVGNRGFKIVLLSRLSPIGPFISVNYAFGLTQVSFGQYGWGTLIGGAPGTILYAFFGAGLHSLHEIITYAEGDRQTIAWRYAFFWASLIVTVAVSAWLAHVARRALRAAVAGDPENQDPGSLQETGSQPSDRFTRKAP
jgi:uncharacterized membrane protein YdjX (TVP38/TMEM64 family)